MVYRVDAANARVMAIIAAGTILVKHSPTCEDPRYGPVQVLLRCVVSVRSDTTIRHAFNVSAPPPTPKRKAVAIMGEKTYHRKRLELIHMGFGKPFVD